MTLEREKNKTEKEENQQTLYIFIACQYHILFYVSFFQDLIETDMYQQKNIVPNAESQ